MVRNALNIETNAGCNMLYVIAHRSFLYHVICTATYIDVCLQCCFYIQIHTLEWYMLCDTSNSCFNTTSQESISDHG